MIKVKFKIEGMKELQKNLKKLGKVPQKHVTSSSKKAMTIVLRQAKANAPVGETGNLKRGIKLVGEKSRINGKKVYRIVFDREMNSVFQKPVKNPGESGNKKARRTAYYPVSQEYGYFLRNGKYKPGLRFIRNALEDNTQKVATTIVDTMKKKIDDEIRKAGLR